MRRRQLRMIWLLGSEAEAHWRRLFLDGLVARGLRGAVYIVSDDHAGRRAARSITWEDRGASTPPPGISRHQVA